MPQVLKSKCREHFAENIHIFFKEEYEHVSVMNICDDFKLYKVQFYNYNKTYDFIVIFSHYSRSLTAN